MGNAGSVPTRVMNERPFVDHRGMKIRDFSTWLKTNVHDEIPRPFEVENRSRS